VYNPHENFAAVVFALIQIHHWTAFQAFKTGSDNRAFGVEQKGWWDQTLYI